VNKDVYYMSNCTKLYFCYWLLSGFSRLLSISMPLAVIIQQNIQASMLQCKQNWIMRAILYPFWKLHIGWATYQSISSALTPVCVNAPARLVFGHRCYDYITDALTVRHWLRLPQWVDYKVAVMACPPYIGW